MNYDRLHVLELSHEDGLDEPRTWQLFHSAGCSQWHDFGPYMELRRIEFSCITQTELDNTFREEDWANFPDGLWFVRGWTERFSSTSFGWDEFSTGVEFCGSAEYPAQEDPIQRTKLKKWERAS